MKKLISMLVISGIITLCFAQSYQDLMQKAKNAENENKWITALGYYYDAAHSIDSQQDAENRYVEIIALILLYQSFLSTHRIPKK